MFIFVGNTVINPANVTKVEKTVSTQSNGVSTIFVRVDFVNESFKVFQDKEAEAIWNQFSEGQIDAMQQLREHA